MTIEGNGSFFNNLMEVLFGWDRENLEDCGGIFLGGGLPANVVLHNCYDM
jgi:hypothetical protein